MSVVTAVRLADVVKAYDVRGLVPEQLNAAVVTALGSAFAQVVVLPEAEKGVFEIAAVKTTSKSLSASSAATPSRQSEHAAPNEPPVASGVVFHTLPAGAVFNLTTRALVPQEPSVQPEDADELAEAGRDLRQLARLGRTVAPLIPGIA